MNKILLALLLAITPTAFASVWYVDGVHGSDSNDCKTRQTACKTIGHAISLSSSGNTVMVAPATYTENLTIGTTLKVTGAGATTTIIDGGGVNTVVRISKTGAHVTLSRVTIQQWPCGGRRRYFQLRHAHDQQQHHQREQCEPRQIPLGRRHLELGWDSDH